MTTIIRSLHQSSFSSLDHPMDAKVQQRRPSAFMNRVQSGYAPSDRTPTCPRAECRGSLLIDPIGPTHHDRAPGLDSLVCTMCGHRGMKARPGLLLLAHDRDEYRFTYGPSLSTLTIILSRKVMHLFPRDMSPVQLARTSFDGPGLLTSCDNRQAESKSARFLEL